MAANAADAGEEVPQARALIEEQPLEFHRLLLGSEQLRQMFPSRKLITNLKHRKKTRDSTLRCIAEIRDKITYKTLMSDNVDQVAWGGRVPMGMRSFRSSHVTPELIQLARSDIQRYFTDIKDPMHPCSAYTRVDDGKATFSPDASAKHFREGRIMPPSDLRALLTERYPHLERMWSIYEAALEERMGMRPGTLHDTGLLHFIHYEPGQGFRPHIDNVFVGNGIVCTITLGTDKIYDMAPVAIEKCTTETGRFALRVQIPEANCVVLDGPSRLEWTHAIPFGREEESFSITYTSRQRNVGKGAMFNRILKTKVGFFMPYQDASEKENEDRFTETLYTH